MGELIVQGGPGEENLKTQLSPNQSPVPQRAEKPLVVPVITNDSTTVIDAYILAMAAEGVYCDL